MSCVVVVDILKEISLKLRQYLINLFKKHKKNVDLYKLYSTVRQPKQVKIGKILRVAQMRASVKEVVKEFYLLGPYLNLFIKHRTSNLFKLFG
jgi:hypothetical protein